MIAGLAACTTIIESVPTATVDFLIDAPLCSSRIPVAFLIDSTIVGTDTFLVHLGTEHTRSRTFITSPGPHTLYARFNTYVWPEKTLTLAAGQSVTDTLPFYCS